MLRNLMNHFFYLGAILLALFLVYYHYTFFDYFSQIAKHEYPLYLFDDFASYYYLTAQQFVQNALPASGWGYSFFSAWLLHPFGGMDYEVAMQYWSWFQYLSLGLLGLTGASLIYQLSGIKYVPFFLFLYGTSVPVLHTFEWGQIAAIVTLMAFWSVLALSRNQLVLSSIFLSLAIALKFYFLTIWIFLLGIQRWFVVFLSFILFFLLCFLLPVLGYGLDTVLLFYQMVFENLRGISTMSYGNPFSQSMLGVAKRFFDPLDSTFLLLFLNLLSKIIFIFTLLVSYWFYNTNQSMDRFWYPFLLLSVCLTFITPTAWHNYFVFLPFAQVFLLSRSTVFWSERVFFLFLSMTLINLFCLKGLSLVGGESSLVRGIFGNFFAYSINGILFWANFIVFWILVRDMLQGWRWSLFWSFIDRDIRIFFGYK